MPISKDEFEKGQKDEMIVSRIQRFLDSNRDTAFTEDEILKRLYPSHTDWPIDRTGFNSAIIVLSQAQKIEVRYVTSGEGNVDIYFKAK